MCPVLCCAVLCWAAVVCLCQMAWVGEWVYGRRGGWMEESGVWRRVGVRRAKLIAARSSLLLLLLLPMSLALDDLHGILHPSILEPLARCSSATNPTCMPSSPMGGWMQRRRATHTSSRATPTCHCHAMPLADTRARINIPST
ncbi:hypothetical protein COCC4DRAFT_55582 [Bipolaris maydis ATCC 48331]|uniref:Secreted protein n=2 Tax=Cochliobolus heterostrophus TaxID=5016 RepID=M2TF31_COCH5|nr:uncharacterized protein COCC4DRAFT_55582 [Bipolaris maydis ATCC 48331]EMD96060.1 hypothetical protein COCHEDRAFT_1026849 [Bipolaris maydis C5]ENI10920.1 hypothetical protein COCC4DRAFT_55582 [Bipolaris maydis ATCC 48331]KAJ6213164.1 hypothetical protein PSV09DRAFT_1026849 [Bipolaris maydis]